MVRWCKITMLSDEEKKAIEVLQYVKNKTPFIFWYEDKPYNRKETINTILNLIEKQSKEIEELKENKGYHLGFIDGGIAKRYEMEDKIKAKIEELDKDENASIPDFIEYAKEYATQKLQSLLEKE